MNKKTSKKVKVECIGKLGPFISRVLPLVEKLLMRNAVQKVPDTDGK